MRLRIVAVIMVALLTSAHTPTADAGGANDGTAAQVISLEKKGWEALKKQDVEGLAGMTADDFVGIFDDGSRVTKDELLKTLPDFRVTKYDLSDIKAVRVTRDVVLLTFKAKYTTKTKGQDAATKSVHAASEWVRRDGKWLNVFYQETALAK